MPTPLPHPYQMQQETTELQNGAAAPTDESSSRNRSADDELASSKTVISRAEDVSSSSGSSESRSTTRAAEAEEETTEASPLATAVPVDAADEAGDREESCLSPPSTQLDAVVAEGSGQWWQRGTPAVQVPPEVSAAPPSIWTAPPFRQPVKVGHESQDILTKTILEQSNSVVAGHKTTTILSRGAAAAAPARSPGGSLPLPPQHPRRSVSAYSNTSERTAVNHSLLGQNSSGFAPAPLSSSDCSPPRGNPMVFTRSKTADLLRSCSSHFTTNSISTATTPTAATAAALPESSEHHPYWLSSDPPSPSAKSPPPMVPHGGGVGSSLTNMTTPTNMTTTTSGVEPRLYERTSSLGSSIHSASSFTRPSVPLPSAHSHTASNLMAAVWVDLPLSQQGSTCNTPVSDGHYPPRRRTTPRRASGPPSPATSTLAASMGSSVDARLPLQGPTRRVSDGTQTELCASLPPAAHRRSTPSDSMVSAKPAELSQREAMLHTGGVPRSSGSSVDAGTPPPLADRPPTVGGAETVQAAVPPLPCLSTHPSVLQMSHEMLSPTSPLSPADPVGEDPDCHCSGGVRHQHHYDAAVAVARAQRAFSNSPVHAASPSSHHQHPHGADGNNDDVVLSAEEAEVRRLHAELIEAKSKYTDAVRRLRGVQQHSKANIHAATSTSTLPATTAAVTATAVKWRSTKAAEAGGVLRSAVMMADGEVVSSPSSVSSPSEMEVGDGVVSDVEEFICYSPLPSNEASVEHDDSTMAEFRHAIQRTRTRAAAASAASPPSSSPPV